MSSQLISLTDTVFEKVAPFYVLFDATKPEEIFSGPLRKYWDIPHEATQLNISLIRPFRGVLQVELFPELTEMQLTLCWAGHLDRPLRGELIQIEDNRWMFVGSPPITSFASLHAHGFSLSDLPSVSGVGDAIIAVESAQISLRQAQKALEDLEASNNSLNNLNQVFGRFVPGAFLESLGISNPSEVKLGDHASVQVSVMFGDMRNFTSMSERMSSKEIFAYLNRFMALVAPNIRNHLGFVVHYIGDGLLALFSGHSDCSVRSAVDMQLALTAALADGELDELGVFDMPLRFGIGMSFGSVEMGIIGESGRWDATIISDTVNVAARIQEYGKLLGSQILVSAELIAGMHSPESFQMRQVGFIQLRGRKEKVEIFEVLDTLPLADRTLRIQNRKIFEQAILEFEEGEITKSQKRLGEYLKLCPNDPVAMYYLEL